MIRLFVALEIPQSVRLQLSLLGGGVAGARWQTPEQFHLTLRFIGEVDERMAQDIDDALRAVRGSGFSLELAGVGEFGGKTPRALWTGARASEALAHLQRKIETALQRIGLAAEHRKFTPHVTLARLRNTPQSKVIEFLSHHALFASDPFSVDRFALFSSQLGSGGSVYHAERSYPLAD